MRISCIQRRADIVADIRMNPLERPNLPFGDTGRNAADCCRDDGKQAVPLRVVDQQEQRARSW
ncbi:hypothetical protein J2X53_003280 [Pseudorhodobacter sp. 4114]|nr:hypothetical protein [Pseudorhodobacter sp. 4114]